MEHIHSSVCNGVLMHYCLGTIFRYDRNPWNGEQKQERKHFEQEPIWNFKPLK